MVQIARPPLAASSTCALGISSRVIPMKRGLHSYRPYMCTYTYTYTSTSTSTSTSIYLSIYLSINIYISVYMPVSQRFEGSPSPAKHLLTFSAKLCGMSAWQWGRYIVQTTDRFCCWRLGKDLRSHVEDTRKSSRLTNTISNTALHSISKGCPMIMLQTIMVRQATIVIIATMIIADFLDY